MSQNCPLKFLKSTKDLKIGVLERKALNLFLDQLP